MSWDLSGGKKNSWETIPIARGEQVYLIASPIHLNIGIDVKVQKSHCDSGINVGFVICIKAPFYILLLI